MPQVGETVNSWTNRSGGEKCLVANSKLETDGYIKQRRTNKQTMGLKQRKQRQHTTICNRHYHHHLCYWLRRDVLSEQFKCCFCLHSFVRIPSRAAQTTMSVTKVLTMGLFWATSTIPLWLIINIIVTFLRQTVEYQSIKSASIFRPLRFTIQSQLILTSLFWNYVGDHFIDV